LAWTSLANGRNTDAKEDTEGQDAQYKDERKSKEALDRCRGTGPKDDGSERMENEGLRSTGMEEGY
jgi:hypothetical protein